MHDSPGNLATGGGGAGPRVATPIEYETRRVGAMLHDPKLLDRDDFLEHVVRSAKEELEGAIDDLRELARGLHPPLLAQQGLEVALRADAARSAIKHARCALVRMSVVHDPGALTVEARDDGIGGASIGEGSASGLCGLRDRVEALDGTLLVESPVGSGTRLVAVFPV